MATLDFISNSLASNFEATFVASSENAVQMEFPESVRNNRVVELFVRVDATMDWVRIKMFVAPPDKFVFAVDVNEGMEVKVASSERPSKAAYLQ